MSDGTAVKKESCGHGVAENMRAHRLRNTCPASIDRERVLDPIPLSEAARGISLGHKKRVVIIPSSRQVTLQPQERTVGKIEHALLVALPDDLGLFALPVDIAAAERQDLRDPGSCAQEHLHQRPEAEPGERHLFPRGAWDNDRVDKALNLLTRQIDHITPWMRGTRISREGRVGTRTTS